MARKKQKRRKSQPRNWAAVSAWNLKGEPHQDKRRKVERKYPHKLTEQ